MDVNMTEREQLQVIKDWWQQNGTWVLGVFLIALFGNIGWNYYHKKQTRNAEYASLIYTKMINSYAASNIKEFKANADYLSSHFPGMPYASLAHFALAKQAVQEGKLDQAVQQFEQVVSSGHSKHFTQIARIRKARVLLALSKVDLALDVLQSIDAPAFMPLVNEVRGDIYLAKGERTKARAEYHAALQAMPTSESNRTILQMKYDQLAGPENGIA